VSPPDALRRFLASAGPFVDRAGDPLAAADALRAAHPGWGAPRERLAIYADFVHHHVEDTLAKVHPRTKAAAGAAWDGLVAGWYARRPAKHFEINALADGFHELVAATPGVPPWLAPLARLEWTELQVYNARVEVAPSTPAASLNPTLEALEHGWRLVAYRTAEVAPGAPEVGAEVALLWRHPRTLKVNFLAANARALLAIKLAAEGISIDEAARQGGVPPDEVRAALREAIEHGLVIQEAS
jgi:hypothetical protein